jgi:toxin ParE1/3/4
MKRHDVRWSLAARDDLERVLDFIAVEAPINAAKVARRIETLSRALETFPNRGRVVPELAQQGVRDWLELSSHPWRSVYRVSGRRVEVVAFLDGRRRLEDVLFERLMQSDR